MTEPKCVGNAYVKATHNIVHDKIYYKMGELRYDGDYIHPIGYETMPCGAGDPTVIEPENFGSIT